MAKVTFNQNQSDLQAQQCNTTKQQQWSTKGREGRLDDGEMKVLSHVCFEANRRMT